MCVVLTICYASQNDLFLDLHGVGWLGPGKALWVVEQREQGIVCMMGGFTGQKVELDDNTINEETGTVPLSILYLDHF